jgi:hypothetical protein
MAQAVITITDLEDGGIRVHTDFDPPAGDDTPSVAQAIVPLFLEYLKNRGVLESVKVRGDGKEVTLLDKGDEDEA